LWTLALAAGVVVASRAIDPTGPQTPLRLEGHELPSVCLVRQLTGKPCISCGLTRGVVYLMRFDFTNGVRSNPLAPLALILGAARTLLALGRLIRRRSNHPLTASASIDRPIARAAGDDRELARLARRARRVSRTRVPRSSPASTPGNLTSL
jgi:hypothetical protein